jgi:hypothetical protein
MRVLVCGGRDYSDWDVFCNVLDYHQPDEIISGMARGADMLAATYARRFKIPLLEFPADWNKHGRAAGPIRNQQMLDEGRPDMVIAFPGGRGTADMVSRAKKAGVRVVYASTQVEASETSLHSSCLLPPPRSGTALIAQMRDTRPTPAF